MALVNPYCTVAQVQAETNNTDSGLTARFEEAIDQASRYIDAWCGRDWFQHDYSSTPLYIRERSALLDGGIIWLPGPVIAFTSITYQSSLLTAGVDFTRDGNMVMKAEGDWEPGRLDSEAIAVRFAYGYAQATSADVPTGIPPEVTRATIITAAAFTGKDYKEVVSADGVRENVIAKQIPRDVEKLLGPRAGRVLV